MDARELIKFVNGIVDSVIKLQPPNGHWVRDEVLGCYRCSRCGAFNPDHSPYCPNCGHKMDWRLVESE